MSFQTLISLLLVLHLIGHFLNSGHAQNLEQTKSEYFWAPGKRVQASGTEKAKISYNQSPIANKSLHSWTAMPWDQSPKIHHYNASNNSQKMHLPMIGFFNLADYSTQWDGRSPRPSSNTPMSNISAELKQPVQPIQEVQSHQMNSNNNLFPTDSQMMPEQMPKSRTEIGKATKIVEGTVGPQLVKAQKGANSPAKIAAPTRFRMPKFKSSLNSLDQEDIELRESEKFLRYHDPL